MNAATHDDAPDVRDPRQLAPEPRGQASGPEGVAPLAVSPRAAARSLGVGHDAIYQLLNEGRLRSLKVGRRRLIPVRELERFLSDELA